MRGAQRRPGSRATIGVRRADRVRCRPPLRGARAWRDRISGGLASGRAFTAVPAGRTARRLPGRPVQSSKRDDRCRAASIDIAGPHRAGDRRVARRSCRQQPDLHRFDGTFPAGRRPALATPGQPARSDAQGQCLVEHLRGWPVRRHGTVAAPDLRHAIHLRPGEFHAPGDLCALRRQDHRTRGRRGGPDPRRLWRRDVLCGATAPASILARLRTGVVIAIGPILWVVATTTLRQRVTPSCLLGRVSAVFVLATGARTIGSALAALIAARFGEPACLLVSLALFILQAAVFLSSDVVRLSRKARSFSETATDTSTSWSPCIDCPMMNPPVPSSPSRRWSRYTTGSAGSTWCLFAPHIASSHRPWFGRSAIRPDSLDGYHRSVIWASHHQHSDPSN